jgi:hypothetical protein
MIERPIPGNGVANDPTCRDFHIYSYALDGFTGQRRQKQRLSRRRQI